jgi:hypothetical protein
MGLSREAAQVQFSFVGKYGMVFSGKHSSRALHLQMKEGQGEELGCEDPSPQETHFGVLLQLLEVWNMLVQLEHFLVPEHAS